MVSQQLEEVLSVTDTLVMHGNSSLLWDAFLVKIPTVCYYGTWFQEQFLDPAKTKTASPLYELGVIKIALTINEIFSNVDYFTDIGNRQVYEDKVDAIKEQYQLDTQTAKQKSERICTWMNNTLQ